MCKKKETHKIIAIYEKLWGKSVMRKPMTGGYEGYLEESRQGGESGGAEEAIDRKPDNVRMARIYLPVMTAVNHNLNFITEAPEDFHIRLCSMDGKIYFVLLPL